ncbi:MAG TPA: 1-phosphofructokinase family hexose kinase [Dongiaceae bacterium]|jgi:6-phosphofructokinase 2|nr:1-phosphofructokinase family hexose kinase [Dongiaceae bacterium]
MQKILTVALNPALDLSTSVPRMLANRKLRCAGALLEPGGGGVNVSRVIRRFGGRSTAFVALGGPTGRTLRELMEREGLDVAEFPIAGATRQNVTVDETAHHLQYRLVLQGPRWSGKEVKAALAEIERLAAEHEFVVATGSLPPGVPEDFYARLARMVRRRGGRLILDTSGPPLRRALEAGVFLVKPNHIEFRDLAGTSRSDWKSMARVGRRLRERGQAEMMIVTRGAMGSLAILPDGVWRLQSPKGKVVSMVGAGDSLIGAAILAIARGKPLLEACCLGVAAASAAVEAPGTELASRAETLRIARRTRVWEVNG